MHGGKRSLHSKTNTCSHKVEATPGLDISTRKRPKTLLKIYSGNYAEEQVQCSGMAIPDPRPEYHLKSVG
ncbi:hypothetical protein UPYG_G00055050 [Umbra pygmaea]|uniref:Uncharacterized protein n=1 Tax=Umbra pygmaea TaxID=75934 RepID=A0ABD0X894_UMBPY